MTAIAIRDLTVAFNGTKACRNLSLDIKEGGVTVLVGRSGSGKTTLLRALNRLNECFDHCRTSGEVRIALSGNEVDAYGPGTDLEALRRKVGMVFQAPSVLPVSIARNMTMPLELVLGLGRNQAAPRMEKTLRDVGLWDEVADRLDHPAATLSGGQQQRLCLARALALEPEILLLDEPTASVDHRSAALIEDLLLELGERLTVVVVSHSLAQARKLAHRLVLLRDGELAGSWQRGAEDADAALTLLLEEAF